MNVAVKFWGAVDSNPQGLPDMWPAYVIEDCDIAPSPDWVIMSQEDYLAYREDNKQLYLDWAAAQPPQD